MRCYVIVVGKGLCVCIHGCERSTLRHGIHRTTFFDKKYQYSDENLIYSSRKLKSLLVRCGPIHICMSSTHALTQQSIHTCIPPLIHYPNPRKPKPQYKSPTIPSNESLENPLLTCLGSSKVSISRNLSTATERQGNPGCVYIGI